MRVNINGNLGIIAGLVLVGLKELLPICTRKVRNKSKYASCGWTRGRERDEIETCPAKGCVILQHVVQPFQRRSRPSGPGNMMHQPLCNRNLQENGSQEPARVQPHSWSRLCLFESCVPPLNVSSNSAFQPQSPAGHSFFSFGRVE